MDAPFALVYLDDCLVVADKPAGLLAVPGRGSDKADCLATRVQLRHPDARIVHRLDMATSGLIVLARGAAVQRLLSAAFAERRVTKTYLAIVQGLPLADEGEVDLPLASDWVNRPRQKVDHDRGKPSLTRWRVLARDPLGGYSRLELQPVTGRSHQLRVHLAAIGHPIVGDALYGSDDPRAPSGPQRLLLHASGLQFDHPASAARLAFDSPPRF